MIPEALVHGALPWLPPDRLRRVLVLRYRPYSDTAEPNRQPVFVQERLSPESLELTESPGSVVKEIARRWMEADGSGGTGSTQAAGAAKL